MNFKAYAKKVLVTLILLIVGILLLIGGMVAVIVLLDNIILTMLVVMLLVIMIGALLIYVIYEAKHLYDVMYVQGILVSTRNMQALSNFDKNFEYLEDNDIEELKMMNQTFKDIAKNVEGRTIISQGLKHRDVPLKYDDEDKMYVNESSLISNIPSLILASETYRNALIDISYSLGRETILEKDMHRIYKTIKDVLTYEDVLISFKENKQGFVIYVPAFDSLNQLKEELEYIMKDISLVKKGPVNKRVVLAHITVAVYPYSSIDNLVKDLAKARKEKKILNMYIPERTFEFNNKLLFSSMNINNTTKLIEDASSIDADPKLYASNMMRIRKCITNISNYYGFHSSGYIEYDQNNEIYSVIYSHSLKEEAIFKEGSRIDSKFINALNAVKDADNSYYFSTREHINNKIAAYLDEYRIRSGLFYVLTRDNKPIGVLFFLNRFKDLAFDAYMKESLITSNNVLGNVLKEINARRQVNVADKRFSEILKLSGMRLYSVNKDTHEIVRCSSSLKKLFPSMDESLPCYKAFYGLNKPCKGCPLKSKKHMSVGIADKQYEVYPILHHPDDPTVHMVVKPNDDSEVKQRFDDEMFLSTFYAFNLDLSSQLLAGLSGNIMLFKVKNIKEVVSKAKNVGYVEMIKEFADRVLEKFSDSGEIYLYNNSTLALILHGKSNDDIVSICQEICEIGKGMSMYDSHLQFIYLVKSYSKEDSVESIQKALADGLEKYKGEVEDEIVFIDSDYRRSASLDGYLLEQLLGAFGEKRFDVMFTPLLSNNSRLIYGILGDIKVVDKNINKEIDIAKAIKIAEDKGFGDILCDGILSYLDDLIGRYSYTAFMSTGLSQIVLPIDHDFITQRRFASRLEEIYKKYSLPKGFIAFQAFEEDVIENSKDFKDAAKKIASFGGELIISEFEGEKLSVEEASELGFKQIKFSASLTQKVNDLEMFEKIASMWSNAHKRQMQVGFSKIESRKVSEAIVFEGYDCSVEGSYFFKPMDEIKVLETVRERNMKDKEGLDN